MSTPFRSTDRILIVRSAWIGDFIVCIPFLEHLVNVLHIPRENLGFLIFNTRNHDPVKAILGPRGFRPDQVRILSTSPRALLASARSMRRFASGFDRICYLPFQTESASIWKKRLAFKGLLGLFRSIEGLRHFEGPGIRSSQYWSLLDVYGFRQRDADYLEFLALDDQEREAPDAIRAGLGPGLKVAVYPSSKLAMKIWPQDRYLQVIRWLRSRFDARVVLVGGREDAALNQELVQAAGDPAVTQVAGSLSIRQTIHLLSGFDLLLGNDGAPLHMGALAKVPIVGLYGRKAPLGMWDPVPSPRMVTLQRDVPCRLCARTECPDPICIRTLTVEDVTTAVERFLAGDLRNGSYLLDGPFDPARHWTPTVQDLKPPTAPGISDTASRADSQTR